MIENSVTQLECGLIGVEREDGSLPRWRVICACGTEMPWSRSEDAALDVAVDHWTPLIRDAMSRVMSRLKTCEDVT